MLGWSESFMLNSFDKLYRVLVGNGLQLRHTRFTKGPYPDAKWIEEGPGIEKSSSNRGVASLMARANKAAQDDNRRRLIFAHVLADIQGKTLEVAAANVAAFKNLKSPSDKRVAKVHVILPLQTPKKVVEVGRKQIGTDGKAFELKFFDTPNQTGLAEAAAHPHQVAVLRQGYSPATINDLLNALDKIPLLRSQHAEKRERLININIDTATNTVHTTRYAATPASKDGAYQEDYSSQTFEDYEEYGEYVNNLIKEAEKNKDSVVIRMHINQPAKPGTWEPIMQLRDKFIETCGSSQLLRTKFIISSPNTTSPLAQAALKLQQASENGLIQCSVFNDPCKALEEASLDNDVLPVIYDDKPSFDNANETPLRKALFEQTITQTGPWVEINNGGPSGS